ncbi:MAG: 2-C-methyl-D-erythritol 2,4-cyclodiphosphate synthase [Candidatus Omnitrophota bacterium]
MRVGIGYDIHRLKKGRRLVLGGVEIPHSKGLDGHSDADVLLHAVCDAILGACGLGDIGNHFPDTDPAYKGISSLELLKKVKGLIESKNFTVVNIDSTLILEEPKIERFKDSMRKNISGAVGIGADKVNVKATTQEGVGPIGSGLAAAALATASVEKK